MAPPASRRMTRSSSVKLDVPAHETGAGKEDGEDDALPAVDSPTEESTSEDEPEAEDTSGPASTPAPTTPIPAPVPMETTEESSDPVGEIPAVGVGMDAEPVTRKHETGLDVDGVEEESSTGATSGYTIPRKKKMKAETAAKPSDPDSVAWNGRPERGSGPVMFEHGMTFVTAKAPGFDVASVPTERYTVVVSGLEVRAVTPTVAMQGLVGIMHEVGVVDGPKVAEDISAVEARGGDLFVTFKDSAACSIFLERVGPVLQHNYDQIQLQLRPIAARGAYVVVRAWMCRNRFREMSAYAQGGRGRGRGRSGGHSYTKGS